MKPFRETHMYDPKFPFIFFYRVDKRKEQPLYHYHDWYEIVYVHGGTGTFLIKENFHTMEAGDLYCIPGNIIHRGISSVTNPYEVSVLLFGKSLVNDIPLGGAFSYFDGFDANLKRNHFKMNVLDSIGSKIEQCLTNMWGELQAQTEGYRHQMLNELHNLLTEISRLNKNNKPAELHAAKKHPWMEDILRYIDQHLQGDLSLEHLAGQALVSPAHFSRVFKKMTGFHLPSYVNAKRMLVAEQLLKQNPWSLAVISEHCGFQSISHFHRTFKSHYGFTPNQYRKHAGMPKEETW